MPVAGSQAIRGLAALEAAIAGGLDHEWRRLVDQDPHASFFQTAGWCLPWYRCYAESFDPYVIVVESGGRLVGVLPMAVDRASGALVFASNTMADYRDIVALPEYREQVVSELISHYQHGRFSGTLQVGWIDPASGTAALVTSVCARRGLRHSVRRQPCWRWFPPAPAKPSAQKFLNWYKRHGDVTFEVVQSESAWERFREEYYRQHTLRQIQTGREKAFDDRRKILYEALFHSRDVEPHVTGFFHNGRMLAGHFGYVWRGVLLLGPPSIRLEDEQRSPAVILLSWIIQNAASLGVNGLDLTIGESDFKKRLGNQCVELSMIEIHRSSSHYYAQTVRDSAVAAAKRLVARAAGGDAWKTHVKPVAAAVAFERSRMPELGLFGAARAILRTALRLVFDRGVERTYALTRDSVRSRGPELGRGIVRENTVEDLLLWQGSSVATARTMTDCARSYGRFLANGKVFHTLTVDGALAGWCYSSANDIHDAFIVPEFRKTSSAGHLVRAAARSRFEQGAAELRITVPGHDRLLQPALAESGRLVAETSTPRLLGSAQLFDRLHRLWRRVTWRAIRRRVSLALRYRAEERTYRLPVEDARELPSSPDFARDAWHHLERFVPSEPRLNREACLEDWRARRARGEHVYTRLEDGRLAAYGWVVERQKTIRLDWVKQCSDLPDESAVIYDFYTLPEYRHRDFYQRLLMHAMQDAARLPGTRWICLSILATDHVPRWWVERIGMELCGSYFYSRTLWLRRKWHLAPMGAHSIA
jgi:CelD/BcsL family acetyltransferase involved in cellulose biosynthesis